jgi:uncharacterized protein
VRVAQISSARNLLMTACDAHSARDFSGKISLLGFAVAAMVLTTFTNPAAAFDCAKALAPVEKLICASPSLLRQDAALGQTYSRMMSETQARDPAEAISLRDAQRRWISERNAACVKPNAAQSIAISCLAQSYAKRMAELAGSQGKSGPSHQAAPAAPKPNHAEAAAQPAAGRPAPAPQPPAPPKVVEAPLPALPAHPAPSAKLLQDQVPAAGEGQALLEVDAPGRFSMRVESKTGVALQLVDMIAGPEEKTGEAGARDGRIDVLLDKGVYKIRSFGAKSVAGGVDAPGLAKLTVTPFHDVSTPSRLGDDVAFELDDLQQRSFVIAVGQSGKVAVEAIGRALADLRLWRDGAELANLTPELVSVEPKPGRSMTRARIEGSVEPGVYVVTAYGGEPIVWTNGDKASPFRIRKAKLHNATGGMAEGLIGPFGVERFELSASANHVRLELPEPVAATLRGMRGSYAPQAVISKAHRDPAADIDLPANDKDRGEAEITGFEGQSYKLRALRSAPTIRVDALGPHLMSVDVAGEGGDELPATAVLARFSSGKTTGVAIGSSAPRIGRGQAWRRRFNLRGPSSIVFEATAPGPVAVRSEGPAITATIEPVLGYNAPRADGKTPGQLELEAGWYVLKIEPVNGAVGVLDLTFGQPGSAPEAKAPAAPRTAIAFGTQTVEKGDYFLVVTGSSPGLVVGPRAVALPADLSKGPVAILQTPPEKPATPKPQSTPPAKPGQLAPTTAPAPTPAPPPPAPLEILVKAPLGGAVTAADSKGAPIAITFSGEKAEKDSRTLTVKIPPSLVQRTVALAWSENKPGDDALPPSIQPQAPLEDIAAGAPRYFNLAKDAQRGFRLDVVNGGLYRVETLGRLKTSLSIATPFLPGLDNADNNGPGHNALMQTYLRAGSYRVMVKVADSSGRLGLTAEPAPLIETGTLVPEGDVRASLAEGKGAVIKGAVIPIEIKEDGDYLLDVYGLDRAFTARLEDGEGWPLAVPGPVSSETQHFSAGHYRLVALPQATDARLVARLRRKVEPKPTQGHGPHPLVFEHPQKHEWREPAAKEAAREPDRWDFSLAGEADVRLDVSDGMVGELIKTGVNDPIARIVHKQGFAGKLGAGRYHLNARSLGRNDRVDYTVSLSSTEIQPGAARSVPLPATLPFAIAEDRVVSLTTFGRIDLNAVLKEAATGRVVERLSGRTDDWNIGLSRRLPAGAYQLELKKTGAASSGDSGESSSSEGETDSSASSETPANGQKTVEVRLALPAAESGPALAMGRAEKFKASGVRQFALPAGEAGRLTVVAAEADAELVLSLEREEGGRWVAQGFERGRAPVLAQPADAKAGAQRISVWTVDGGEAEISLSAQSVTAEAQALGAIALKPVTLEGVKTQVRAALVNTPAASLVSLARLHDALRQGSAPGAVMAPATGGVIVPQNERLWLLSSGEGDETLSLAAVDSSTKDISLALAEGEKARLSGFAVNGKTRLWLAESRFGQPGLDAGEGMGVARDSVLAPASLASGAELHVWNAGGGESLRVRVAAIDVETIGEGAAKVDGQFAAVLPPFSRQVITLADKGGQVTVDLAPGTAAFAGSDKRRDSVWAGREAVSRALGQILGSVALINASDKPAPVRVTVTPGAGAPAALAAGQVFKRFFGATGSLSAPVEAQAGDRLVVVGGEAVFVGKDGGVSRGRRLTLSGPGEVVLEHGAGLLAAWIERGGQSPWPAVRASTAKLPSTETLKGEAMSYAIASETPMLLHARTTAPVILALSQGGEEEPELYPAGAELHRYVAPGKAELRVYSPHDGPLSGALELSSTPIAPVGEGVGEPVALAAGGTALFGFEMIRPGPVGVGVRSEPDTAQMRLLDAKGKALGQGVSLFQRLEPGRYVIEARVPASGGAAVVRPSVVGAAPPPSGPPSDVVEKYLDMAGVKSARGR